MPKMADKIVFLKNLDQWMCNTCFKLFKWKSNATRHVRSIHPGYPGLNNRNTTELPLESLSVLGANTNQDGRGMDLDASTSRLFQSKDTDHDGTLASSSLGQLDIDNDEPPLKR